MGPELELRHLRYFVAVAEELHFGRAAARLQMAQPPLSQQIRKLETMIGAPLFVRTSRSVALTPAGQVFLLRAQHLLGQARTDLEEAARIGRGEAGRLDVGFISSAIFLGVTDRIRTFRSRFPAVQLRLHEAFSATIVVRVQERQLDLGVVRDTEPQPDLETRTLATEKFVAVVPADHPAAAAEEIAAAALRSDPFVLFPRIAGELAYRRNLQPCQEAGYEPDVVQEASNWTTILALVGAGLGVTIAPVGAAGGAPPSTRVLGLRDTDARTVVQVVRRRDDARAIVDNFFSD